MTATKVCHFPQAAPCAYIGRIGALAVALGVGMAVATTPGVATATPDAQNSTDSTGAATAPTDATNAGSVATPSSTTSSDSATTTQSPTGTSATAASSQSPTEATQTSSVAPEVVVRSSGGALTSDQSSPSDPATAGVPAVISPTTDPTPPPAVNTQATEQSSVPIRAAESVAAHSSSSPTRAAETARNPEIDPAVGAAPVESQPADATVLRMSAVDAAQAQTPSAAEQLTTFAALAPPPLPAPASPISAVLALPVTLIKATANFVTAAMAAFLAPAPGTPAQSPLLWTVLAIVRRQFFNETPTIAYTVAPPDALGNIRITLNQTDADGDVLTYTATDGTQGTVTVNPDGHSLTYDPGPGATGTDTFTVTATDANSGFRIHGVSSLLNMVSFGLLGNAGHTTSVAIAVPTNSGPTATNDAATVFEGGTKIIGVTANDTDSDGLDLGSLTVTQQPGHGTVTVNADGTVTYTSDGGEVLTDTFTYTINDTKDLTSNTATVNVTITPVNDPPVAVNDNVEAFEGGNTSFFVALNDTDAERGIVLGSVTITQGPAHGTVTVNADGSINYIHDGSETTSDSFKYTVKDIDGATSNEATVTVTVFPVNDRPVANPDVVSANQGDTVIVDVLDNDTDAEEDALSVVSWTTQSGVVSKQADGSLRYVPDPSFFGTNTVTYTISDGELTSSSTLTITVNARPVAVNDGANTAEDTPLSVADADGVLKNDSDADHGPLTAVLVSGPTSAKAFTLNADGSYTYTPNDNFTGTDSFTYRVSDGTATSAPGTVTITVTPVNHAPVVQNVSGTLEQLDQGVFNLLAVASDPDGDQLSVKRLIIDDGQDVVTIEAAADPTVLFVNTAHGNYVIVPNQLDQPSFTATGLGTDVVSVVVTDGTAETTGTVTITVIRSGGGFGGGGGGGGGGAGMGGAIFNHQT